MNCTRCEGTGFLNSFAIPQDIVESGHHSIMKWTGVVESDVTVCDCCGNGEEWYGVAGEHYGGSDPRGPNGPYAYNGGLCECH